MSNLARTNDFLEVSENNDLFIAFHISVTFETNIPEMAVDTTAWFHIRMTINLKEIFMSKDI